MDETKVKLVSVEEGITALGFRRVAAVARKLNPTAEIYFIPVGNLYSFSTHLFPGSHVSFSNKDIDTIAEELAETDLLCFSSLSPSAAMVERLAQAVKRKNSKIFILWGGTHCIINPEEAIKHVDAICTGEGEINFEIFYRAFQGGKEYLTTPSIWFNAKEGIVRNKNRQLSTSKDLDFFPHLFYDSTCKIYNLKSRMFRQFNHYDYVGYNGLSYRTVWSIGCPFSCIYCANDAFLSIDGNYGNIRYPSVDYILEEIENAIRIYPFISTVVFYDDNFINIPFDVLEAFAREYKRRIGLPFVVFGMHPNFITKEKIDLLAGAGMNRARMGIQSGSPRILSFYNRPTPLPGIQKSAEILADISKRYPMIPSAYDVISDNPVETKDDIVQTLKFLYGLKRPYTLTIFSLRVFEKTKLWDYFKDNPSVDIRCQTSSYLETRKTMANILLYTLAIIKPPRVVFFWLLNYVKGYQEKQRSYPILYFIVKGIYLLSRGISHLRKLDFTNMVGPCGLFFWKLGLIKYRFRKLKKKDYSKVPAII